jgi:hypothetical protein
MKKEPKNAEKFLCSSCDFECSKKSNYDKHISTAKHKNRTKLNVLEQKNAEKCQFFYCKNCNKEYNARNSLWYHEQKCKIVSKQCETENPTDKNLIMMLIKENSELKHMVLDVCQKIQPINNTVNSHNITNNKTFNLNVFLNEHCKDAMNIMDFVDSLKLQLSDLETVGKLGFVDGISNIIVKNLNAMDIHKRPVHCSDAKRDVMYVKDEDKWEKENEKNKKLRKVIKHIAHKNSKMLPEFKSKYPDCGKSDSKYSDQYNNLIIEAMGGRGDNDIEKEDKIIKNIAKEMVIDKLNLNIL